MSLLDEQYKRAEKLFGKEPAIYVDFEVNPEGESTSVFQKSNKRIEIYSTQVNTINKEA